MQTASKIKNGKNNTKQTVKETKVIENIAWNRLLKIVSFILYCELQSLSLGAICLIVHQVRDVDCIPLQSPATESLDLPSY